MVEDKRPLRSLQQQERHDPEKVPDMYLDNGTTLNFGSESNANFVDVISVAPIESIEDIYINETNVNTEEFPLSEFHTHNGDGSDKPFQGDFEYVERTIALGKQAEIVDGPNDHTTTTKFTKAVSSLGVKGVRINFTTGGFTHRDLKNRRKFAQATFRVHILNSSGDRIKTVTNAGKSKFFSNNPMSVGLTILADESLWDTFWEYEVEMIIRTNKYKTAVSGTWSASTVTELYTDTQTYDNIAYCSGKVVAQDVGSSVPKRQYLVKGYKVDVPDIRAGEVFWNGRFKQEWSNNQAWNALAVLINTKWGGRVPLERINIYSFYAFSQYCEEVLNGGSQRYTHSQQLVDSDNYFRVASQIVGTADGKLYEDGSGRIGVLIDKQESKRRVVTSYDLVNEKVKRTTVPDKNKINYVQAEFPNKANLYQKDIIFVEDTGAIVRNGLIKKELNLDTCNHEEEAKRVINKVLKTSQVASSTYVFTVGHTHEDLQVGEVIELYDRKHSRVNYCGKTAIGSSQTVLAIDPRTPINLTGIQNPVLVLDNGREDPTRVKIDSWTDYQVVLETALSQAPAPFTSFGVESELPTGLKPTLVRVLGLTEKGGQIDVEAVEYNDSLYDHVEKGTDLVIPTTRYLPEPTKEVELLTLVKNQSTLVAQWDLQPDTEYTYYWKKYPNPNDLTNYEFLGGGTTTTGSTNLNIDLEPVRYTVSVYIYDSTTGIGSTVKEASIVLQPSVNGTSPITPPTNLRVADDFQGTGTLTYTGRTFGLQWDDTVGTDETFLTGYLLRIFQDGNTLEYNLDGSTRRKVIPVEDLVNTFGPEYSRQFNVTLISFDNNLDTTNGVQISVNNSRPEPPTLAVRDTGDVLLTSENPLPEDLVGSVVYIWPSTNVDSTRPATAARVLSSSLSEVSIPDGIIEYNGTEYVFEASWLDGFGEYDRSYSRVLVNFDQNVLTPVAPEITDVLAQDITKLRVTFNHGGVWLQKLRVYFRPVGDTSFQIHPHVFEVQGDSLCGYDETTGDGYLIVEDLTYNTEYEVYLVAQNTLSVESDPSEIMSGSVKPYADVQDIVDGLDEARQDILDNRQDINTLETVTTDLVLDVADIEVDLSNVQEEAQSISDDLLEFKEDIKPKLDLEIRSREETDEELFKTTAALASFKQAQDQYNSDITDAIFYVDPDNGQIGFKAYQYTDTKFSQANVLIDGVNSRIDLNVQRLDVLDQDVIDARSEILLLAGEISLKASYTEMTEYVSGAIDAVTPAYSFGFFNSPEGWVAVNGTLTHTQAGELSLVWGDIENVDLSYSADENPIITINCDRVSGSGWVGDLIITYSTGGSQTYSGVFTEGGGVKTLNLSSESTYTGIVTGLRIVLGESSADEFTINSIVIGKPSAQLEQLDNLTAKVNQAEININAIEGQLTSFVTTTYYDENSVTLNNVSTVLDSEQVIIDLKASQQELDENGTVEKANQASIWIGDSAQTIRSGIISFNAEDGGIDDQLSALVGGLNTVEQTLSTIDGAQIQSNLVSINSLEIESQDLSELQYYQQIELLKQRDGLLDVGENVATATQTLATLSDDVSANASSILSLQASSGTLSGQLDAVFDQIAVVNTSLDGVARVANLNRAEVIQLDTDLSATSDLLQSTILDVEGNATALNQLAVRVTDTEGDLQTGAEILQQVQTTANGNTTAIQGLTTQFENLETDVAANVQSIQNIESDVSGNTTAIQNLSVSLGNTNLDIQANTDLIQQVQLDVDGNTDALTQLTTRVENTEQGVTANASFIQQVNNSVTGLNQVVTGLSNDLDLAEQGITANSNLIQQLRSDTDGNTTSISQLGVRVTNTEQGITANSDLIQEVTLEVDGNTTAINQLGVTLDQVSDEVTGQGQAISANADLIQQVNTKADGNTTAINQLTTRVANEEANTQAQLVINSEVDEDLQEVRSSISNQLSSIDRIERDSLAGDEGSFYNIIETIRQKDVDLELGDSLATAETQLVTLTNDTGALAQEILTLTALTQATEGQVLATLDRVSSVETSLNGVAQSLFSVNSQVSSVTEDLASAQLTLESTVNDLGEVSSRAYLGVSQTVDGKTDVTGVVFDSSTNGIRFKGDILELVDNNDNQALFYNSETGKWIFNGSLVVNGYSVDSEEDIRAQDGSTIYEVYQYSVDGTSGWHDIFQTGDFYRRTATSTNGELGPWSDAAKITGRDGVDAVNRYTWIKYADTATGDGLSDDPTGKRYIGLAYNKETVIESTTPSDYTWSALGRDGVDGDDATERYTWIKYSDNQDGTGLYSTPTDSTKYIGIAVNKTTLSASNNPADYVWSRFKGGEGVGSFTLVSSNSNTKIEGNTISKISGGDGWNAGAYSTQKYEAISVSAKVPQGNAMIGISGSQSDASFTTLDFAMYNSSGLLRIYESGSNVFTGGSSSHSDLFTIVCDGKKVRYYQNGNLVYTSSKTPSGTYGFDSSLHTSVAIISDVVVTSSGYSGTDGEDGNDGSRGAGRYETENATGGWSVTDALSALPDGTPVEGDVVQIFKAGDPAISSIRIYQSGNWTTFTLRINGNALVEGTVVADEVRAGSVFGENATFSGKLYAENIEGDIVDVVVKETTGVFWNNSYGSEQILQFTVNPRPFERYLEVPPIFIEGGTVISFYLSLKEGSTVVDDQTASGYQESVRVISRNMFAIVPANTSKTYTINVLVTQGRQGNAIVHAQKLGLKTYKAGDGIS